MSKGTTALAELVMEALERLSKAAQEAKGDMEKVVEKAANMAAADDEDEPGLKKSPEPDAKDLFEAVHKHAKALFAFGQAYSGLKKAASGKSGSRKRLKRRRHR